MTETITARLDNEIRLSLDELRPEWMQAMHGLINIPNREKEEAVRLQRYGANDMPDEIALWYEDGGWLVLPRGLRDPLVNGFKEIDVEVAWDDRRTSDRVFQFWPAKRSLRPQQGPAAARLLAAQEGIYEAPAGSGKTVSGLELVRIARQRWNLVIVNEVGIAKQWEEEAHDHLGDYGFGRIGGGVWREGRLTFATLQTLYSRAEQLPWEWWAKWGLVMLDECHHQTARTFVDIMSRFPALIRVGLSATPDKTGDFDIAQAVLGDIVARTTRHELREMGILKRPTIKVVDSGFHFDYWPDHTATKKEGYVCQKPRCPKSGKQRHSHQNNYAKMLKALVEDEGRNDVIAREVKAREGHRTIVTSNQTKQLHEIARAFTRNGVGSKVYWLIGDTSEEDRERVRKELYKTEDAVLLTTIADEAFNCPPLDTLVMPFPTKNVGSIRQRVGRVERDWPGKGDPLVIDLRDSVGPLLRQFATRRWEVYAPELYNVERYEEEEAA